ncbi:MAG: glycosyltransferase family 4 protein [Actinomycetota bacterium]|nr:glycosyltransferase family 4 protein [Actinomycetota bacterium]
MAKAILVTSSFLPGRGGIESYLAALCEELQPHLAVVAPARREGRSIPDGLGYPTIGYEGPLLYPGPRVRRAVEEAASDHSTDRILFGTPWPLALMGPKLKEGGLSYSVIVHGAEMLVPSVIPGLGGALARALAASDLLLPVSNFTRRKIESFVSRKGIRIPRTEVLRARVDLGRFSPEAASADALMDLGIPTTKKLVLSLGRLVRRKGTHRLLDAIDEMADRVPDVALVVAGTGPQERTLRRRARSCRSPVIFTGRVPEAQLPALYASAQVFALPVADRYLGLDTEGLGVVLVEASASGTPCVTGRSGGTPEAVLDGKTGFVIDAADRSALVDRVVRLLENREAAEMGLAARAHARGEFGERRLPAALLDWLGLGDAEKQRYGEPPT